jgi:hypothetical protein
MERPAHLDARDNRRVEQASAVQLCDVCLRHMRVLRILRKDRRAVVGAGTSAPDG